MLHSSLHRLSEIRMSNAINEYTEDDFNEHLSGLESYYS